MASQKKRIMYFNRRAPYGTAYALEALDVVLAGAVFEQEVSVVFVDDGVYQLKRGQNPSVLNMKDFSKTFGALPDFDVMHLYVEQESLAKRGLTVQDLIEVPRRDDTDAVTPISSADLSVLMDRQDVVLQF
ncbi:MAG: sulfurtransferase complex subunit TusC [Acidiferrobacterales bacterium]|nr:sulfurtransferase complex subunit TusC [Acidiferrobacterales bacterium]